MKTVRLQHQKYFGKDDKTEYIQHRINIPHDIIRNLGWSTENEITLSVKDINDRKIIILDLKTKN